MRLPHIVATAMLAYALGSVVALRPAHALCFQSNSAAWSQCMTREQNERQMLQQQQQQTQMQQQQLEIERQQLQIEQQRQWRQRYN